MRTLLLLLTTAVLSASCGTPTSPPAARTAGAESGAHLVHEAYVTAINSSNLDELLGVLTDDVVFLSAHEPAVVEDTGWGLVIYHHDADGKWRVARDAFGPDHPPAM